LDRLQNTAKKRLAEMTCHLINTAVMTQDCVEVLNQHAQPLKNEAVAVIIETQLKQKRYKYQRNLIKL